MFLNRCLFLFGFILAVQSAFARPICAELLQDPSAAFEDIEFENAELESKFIIPSKDAFTRLKTLMGRQITLRDVNGRALTFEFSFDREHIYEDINYDTKKLALFKKRGMLRERVRYDRFLGQRKFRFKKAVFQAKDGPVQHPSLSAAFFARNEIRGEEFKRRKLFYKQREKLLEADSDDQAVSFAREYSESSKRFRPVLFIRDSRFFMILKQVGETNSDVPWFYVSLDNVKYHGLIGAKGKARRLELEAEMNDELSESSPVQRKAKIHLLNELSRYFEGTWGLKPSGESKYEAGINLTVLSDGDQN